MSRLTVNIDGREFQVEMSWLPSGENEVTLREGDTVHKVVIPGLNLPLEEMEWLIVDGRPRELIFDDDLRWVKGRGGLHRVELSDQDAPMSHPHGGDGRVKAPIPGLITRVLVEVGQTVAAGQTVVMLEAMKMENEIRATRAGTVRSIAVQKGKGVVRGDLIAEIE